MSESVYLFGCKSECVFVHVCVGERERFFNNVYNSYSVSDCICVITFENDQTNNGYAAYILFGNTSSILFFFLVWEPEIIIVSVPQGL